MTLTNGGLTGPVRELDAQPRQRFRRHSPDSEWQMPSTMDFATVSPQTPFCCRIAAAARKQRPGLMISRRCYHEIQCEDTVHWAAERSSSRHPLGGCRRTHPSDRRRNECPGRVVRDFDKAHVDRVCERGERDRVELNVGFRRCAVRAVGLGRQQLGAVRRRFPNRHDLQPYRALRWRDLLLYSARGGRYR